MEGWAWVAGGWVLIPITAIVLGLLYAFSEEYMKHRREMMKMKLEHKQANNTAPDEYQEFVLGVDTRIQRLEDRIRLLESKLRQNGESEDIQRINRG
ncbi:MAG: hypothetical protein ACYC27_20070 [Armatimonadota bacterium]